MAGLEREPSRHSPLITLYEEIEAITLYEEIEACQKTARGSKTQDSARTANL